MFTARISAKRLWLRTEHWELRTVSSFLPDSDVIRVGDGDKVQQAGNDHEFCAVVGGRESDCALSPIVGQRQNVESARAHVADEAEDIKDVAAIRFIDAALHGEAQQKQSCD